MANSGNLFFIALLWTGWCVCHSLLICRTVTAFMRQKLGRGYAWYRFFFNIFSAITLLPVIYYHFTLPRLEIFAWHGPWRLLQGALLSYALFMFMQGKKNYDMPYFLGIRQVRAYLDNGKSGKMPFQVKGRAFVRHPWYSAGIALAWGGGDISDVTLVSKLIISLYFIVGAFLEERKMMAVIGEPYREFCRNTPMLIPFGRG